MQSEAGSSPRGFLLLSGIVSGRFLPVQEPFFMLDGSLCMGYNMLNKTADKEGHSFPFRRNHLTVTFK